MSKMNYRIYNIRGNPQEGTCEQKSFPVRAIRFTTIPPQAIATKTDLLEPIVTLTNNKKYKSSMFFNLVNIFTPIFIKKELRKESDSINP